MGSFPPGGEGRHEGTVVPVLFVALQNLLLADVEVDGQVELVLDVLHDLQESWVRGEGVGGEEVFQEERGGGVVV